MPAENFDHRTTVRETGANLAWSLGLVFRVAPAVAVGYALLQVLEGINPALRPGAGPEGGPPGGTGAP